MPDEPSAPLDPGSEKPPGRRRKASALNTPVRDLGWLGLLLCAAAAAATLALVVFVTVSVLSPGTETPIAADTPSLDDVAPASGKHPPD